tara:strand:- start:345 stop:710 length:366 start_codon:yes stop_codon:yes gene_type:complete
MNDQPASYKEYKKTTENPSSEGYAKYLEKMQTLKKKKKGQRPGITSSLRKEVGQLLSAGMSASKIVEKLGGTSAKNPHKKETIKDQIRDYKANLPKNNKNNIVKRFKGGLMVKPKAAKRGY